MGEVENNTKKRVWLLAWNPSKWVWDKFEEWCEKTKQGGVYKEDWRCQSKQTSIGDEVYLMRLGDVSYKGIMAHGYVIESVYQNLSDNEIQENSDDNRNYIGVSFDRILNYNKQKILEQSLLNTEFPNQHWSPQGSGIEIKPEYVDRLAKLWEQVVHNDLDSVAFKSRQNDFNKEEPESKIFGAENVIVYGVPGSGKSYLVNQEYCKDADEVRRVVFHPEYSYGDFSGQILPTVSEGKIEYKFVPGPFTEILKEAHKNPDKKCILIIEEINRGNAPAIFGDIFQLLDRRKVKTGDHLIGSSEYSINNSNIAKIINSKDDATLTANANVDMSKFQIEIPANLWIVATMNTSDQNVFTLDTAFQRRWTMRLVNNSFSSDKSGIGTAEIMDTGVTWKTFCEAINAKIMENSHGISSSGDKRLGVHFVSEDEIKSETKNENKNETKDKIRNNKFAEKVLKYLWDDAFKFNRSEIFEYKTLEETISNFMEGKAMERFSVFRPSIRDSFKQPELGESTANQKSVANSNGSENNENM